MGRRNKLHRCPPDVAKPSGGICKTFPPSAEGGCNSRVQPPLVLARTASVAGIMASARPAACPSLAGSSPVRVGLASAGASGYPGVQLLPSHGCMPCSAGAGAHAGSHAHLSLAGSSGVRPSLKMDFANILRMFENPVHRSTTSLMAALGQKAPPSIKSKDGAPPRQVLKHLASAKAEGLDIASLADGVVERRFMCKIAATSTATYASHLRMIGWACELFGHEPLGCTVAQIRRVAAVCSCASTQRGWLSAWAMAHQLAGQDWAGDADIILRGLRLGTLKCQVPRLPRNRIDRKMIRPLLQKAIVKGKIWWAVILILTYSFLLRMPSELFAQYKRELVSVHGGRFVFGPIRRKQRIDWCEAVAFCVCAQDQSLCLHEWLPVLDELENKSREQPALGGYSPSSWTSDLRDLLSAIGVPEPADWYGHDVRRGGAADAFAASGVHTMLSRGGWRSVAGARPYVSGDEINAGLLAQSVIDDSSPEN